MRDKFIDLHVHSDYSDGFDDIHTIIKKAKENNVGTLSLTEHYNLSSFYEAQLYAGNDLEVIPGIEIGADMSYYGYTKKSICHILGYFISPSICKLLDEYELERYKCVIKTLELLHKNKVDISLEDVMYVARNRNSIGRFDIAIALAYLGYARTPQEAYGLYFDHRGKNYVERKKLNPTELVKKIIECGGVPVLAHPKSLHMVDERREPFIKDLVEAGLKGIEVYNCNNNEEQREYYLDICKEYDLISTVGSDYHGGNRKPEIVIGHGIEDNLCISDYEIVKKLKLEKRKLDDKW